MKFVKPKPAGAGRQTCGHVGGVFNPETNTVEGFAPRPANQQRRHPRERRRPVGAQASRRSAGVPPAPSAQPSCRIYFGIFPSGSQASYQPVPRHAALVSASTPHPQ
jgi:hypothetical protein